MASTDPIDKHVAEHVAEQIAALKQNSGIDRAWKALNDGRNAMPYHITWDHVANRVEDNYREMNLLRPRKKNENDHYYLRKITQPPT